MHFVGTKYTRNLKEQIVSLQKVNKFLARENKTLKDRLREKDKQMEELAKEMSKIQGKYLAEIKRIKLLRADYEKIISDIRRGRLEKQQI